MISLRAALRCPERVRALVLIDSDGGAEPPSKKLEYFVLGKVVRFLGIRPVLRIVLKKMFGSTTQQRQPSLVREWEERFLQVHAPSMLRVLKALNSRKDISSRLSVLNVPCLILHGQEDQALPPQRSKLLQQSITGSRLELIAEAGHLLALEAPDKVNLFLQRWLSSFEQNSTGERGADSRSD